MSQEPHAAARPERDLAAELRLRPERPPVTRLSRKVLLGLMAGAGIAVSGALIWALYQGRGNQIGGGELYNTDNKTTPDGLAALPRDYSGIAPSPALEPGVPRLGPPLPGDLGRPILNAQREGVPIPEANQDPAQQRVAQEQEAARTSRLFASTNTTTRQAPSLPSPVPISAVQTGSGSPDAAPIDSNSIQNMQDRKLAFVALGPANRIAVVDAQSFEVKKYLLVGQRVWNMAFSPDEKRLYTVNGASNDVSAIDVADLKVTKSVPVGRLPWGVAVAP